MSSSEPHVEHRAPFLAIFGVDAVVRSAYQVGKSPVLPLFAASLGAGAAGVGVVASASVVTGMFVKPQVGLLSDRTGRRRWLWLALAVFVLPPFFYGFVQTPAQLMGLRFVHGFATALFGPVSVAYVVALGSTRVAERMGWFGMARATGSVTGPLIGAALLTLLSPAWIYVVVGVMSLVAVPLLATLPQQQVSAPRPRRTLPSPESVPRAVWAMGAVEAMLYVGTYAMKTFLPLTVLTGAHIGWVGLALAAHEGTAMLLRPATGRWADRHGDGLAVVLGAGLVGLVLPLTALCTGPWLVFAAASVGVGQALLSPASTALAARCAPPAHLGEQLGWLGALRNAGKVSGPVLCGLLMGVLGFAGSLFVLGVALLLAAAMGARVAAVEPVLSP